MSSESATAPGMAMDCMVAMSRPSVPAGWIRLRRARQARAATGPQDPARFSISSRTRSITGKATEAPSSLGSTWTRNGRSPNGVSTGRRWRPATAAGSASGGTIWPTASWICGRGRHRDRRRSRRRGRVGRAVANAAKWSVPRGKAPGTTMRGLDAPARQLAGILDGQRVHPGLGREMRREVGRRAAGGAAARHPDQQALAHAGACAAGPRDSPAGSRRR